MVCFFMMMGMACIVVVCVLVDFFFFKCMRKLVYQGFSVCVKNIDVKYDKQEICGGFFYVIKGVCFF